jgi:hypothetical protein
MTFPIICRRQKHEVVSMQNPLFFDRLERILTMVYVVQNSQNFSGLFLWSCISKNTTFRKLDLFPSSGEGGGEAPTQLGPLQRPNLNPVIQFPKRRVFLEYRTMEKVQ